MIKKAKAFLIKSNGGYRYKLIPHKFDMIRLSHLAIIFAKTDQVQHIRHNRR